MTDYAFQALPAFDPTTSTLLPGASFTFQDNAGNPVPIKSLSGVTQTSLTASPLGMVPGFLATDVSVGFLVNAAGLKIPTNSTWAQDPAQVAAAVAASATAAATSASQASTVVSSVSTGLNTLAGRVTALEQGGTGGASKVPGTKTPITIFASDYGNAWPSPIRLTTDASYSVTFVGSIAAPPAVAAGSDQGMQPGDFYYYVGS